MKNVILQGDALSRLKDIPGKSVDMCMTSPPYWALRDYGVGGQLGLEPTFDKYISELCDIFDGVKRVLRDDGTCWVNIGDTYSGTGSKGNYRDPKYKEGRNGQSVALNNKTGLPSKSLCMIPMRFAIEMVNRGWILRNTIIWHKPNAMPSSAKDRFTVDFEYIFLFSKKKKYYFETQYEPMVTNDTSRPRGSKGVLGSLNSGRRVPYSVQPRTKEFVEYRDLPDIKIFAEYINNVRKQERKTIDEVEESFGNQAPHHWFNAESFPSVEDYKKLKNLLLLDDSFDNQMTKEYKKSSEKTSSPKGRIKRTVWSICPKPFKNAHFAVYPEALCETPIKAGCPEGGIVLDPFFGAGTTGLVALKQNKNYIGIELNPEYIEIAEKRLKPFQDQTTLNLNNTSEVQNEES